MSFTVRATADGIGSSVCFCSLYISGQLTGKTTASASDCCCHDDVGFHIMCLAYMSLQQNVNWEARAEANKPVPPNEKMVTADPGYEIYKSSCANCHGSELQGGAAAPSLIGTNHSPEEIAKIAKKGIRTMPSVQFKGNDKELKQLVEFIASVNSKAK